MDNISNNTEYLVGLVEDILSQELDLIETLDWNFEFANRLILELKIEQEDIEYLKLVKRITRHFIFNYFIGFMFLKFVIASSHEYAKSARQRNIEEALKKLASQFDYSRIIMKQFFEAALNRNVHALLRSEFKPIKYSFKPRSIFNRILIRLGLNDDWEKLSEHGLKFGLSGFFLFSEAYSHGIPEEDFSLILNYIYKKTQERLWWEVEECCEILRKAKLMPFQTNLIFTYINDLLNENYEDPNYLIRNEISIIEEMELSPILTFIQKFITRLLMRRDRDLDLNDPPPEETIAIYQAERVRKRKFLAIKILGILEIEPRKTIDIHQKIINHELIRHKQKNLPKWFQSESLLLEESISNLLRLTPQHTQAIQTIIRYLEFFEKNSLPDQKIDIIRESKLEMKRHVADYLIGLFKNFEFSVPVIEQILINIQTLDDDAVQYLIKIIKSEEKIEVQNLIIRMYVKNLYKTYTLSRLRIPIANHLSNLFFNTTIQLQEEWIRFCLMDSDLELLRRILIQSNRIIKSGDNPTLLNRTFNLLTLLSSEVVKTKKHDLILIAVCILVSPDSTFLNNRSFDERLDQAVYLIGNKKNRRIIERVFDLIKIAFEEQSPLVLSAVKSTRNLSSYNHSTYNFLDYLVDRISKQKHSIEYMELLREVYKSIATINPTSKYIYFDLKDALMDIPTLDNNYYRNFLIDAFLREILPVAVGDIHKDVVDYIMEFVERPNSFIYSVNDCYGIILILCLQLLANVTNLTEYQQDKLIYLYRYSREVSVKGLCLLILCRQRPLRAKTFDLLEITLRTNYWTAIRSAFLNGVFSRIVFGIGILTCQVVAVHSANELLREKKTCDENQRERLIKALTKSSSIIRQMISMNLAESQHCGWPETVGLAQLIGRDQDYQHESHDLSWTIQPTNEAYLTLWKLWKDGIAELKM